MSLRKKFEDFKQKAWEGTIRMSDEIARLREENARLIKERDDWRKNFDVLAKAIVGETGLSAIEEATKLKARAQSAEAERDAALKHLHEIAAFTEPHYLGAGLKAESGWIIEEWRSRYFKREDELEATEAKLAEMREAARGFITAYDGQGDASEVALLIDALRALVENENDNGVV